ncbi:hypothetical protein K402DRAFT_441459 [Aulographum hederae CBS 113979]|uniref:Rhodopsin domain-containing protein n=1 Tax=Aulographum hederae CBS 113979 TaxID=1176131 RepID=A0A6G1GJS6_9PEZI|nr:hypothetical protein K402DRAFT_441459 [Aulographum hederae CBS 113979]
MEGDRGYQLNAVLIALLSLAYFTTALRCWTRIRIVKAFALDDWLTLITLALFTGFCVSFFWGISRGYGRHLYYLTLDQKADSAKSYYLAECFNTLCALFIRLAVGAYLLRVAVKRFHRWIIYFVLAINTCVCLAFFLIAVFQCNPIRHYWRRFYPGSHGKCLIPHMDGSPYMALSILATGTDIVLGIVPVLVVKDLNMSRKEKFQVAAILSLGVLICIAAIIRIPYSTVYVHDADFLWKEVDIAIWSGVEPGLGITAVSCATLRPLIRTLRTHLTSSHKKSTSNLFASFHKRSSPSRPSGGPATPKYNSQSDAKYGIDFDMSFDDTELRGLQAGTGTISTVEAAARRPGRLQKKIRKYYSASAGRSGVDSPPELALVEVPEEEGYGYDGYGERRGDHRDRDGGSEWPGEITRTTELSMDSEVNIARPPRMSVKYSFESEKEEVPEERWRERRRNSSIV